MDEDAGQHLGVLGTVKSGAACVGHAAFTILHMVFMALMWVLPLLLPRRALPWFLGIVPLALVLFALLQECGATLVEDKLACMCAERFPGHRGLPRVPLTPREARYRSPTFAKRFPNNFMRRTLFAATGGRWRASASDVRELMLAAWALAYFMFMLRGGHLARGLRGVQTFLARKLG
jgi:hypothetical protein